MRHDKAFFDLQIRFAQSVASVTDIPIEYALLNYTNIYVRLGCGRAFDSHHPIWRHYADALAQSGDIGELTHRTYLATDETAQTPNRMATFGCFSYEMQDPGCVRLHFDNKETAILSPLSVDRRPIRLSELRALFVHIRRHQPYVTRVVGTSWLYNLPAYQRLFPEEYIASASNAGSRFRNMSLWGQFLDRHGAVKRGATEKFLNRLSHADNLQDLLRSFPLQALAVESRIEAFIPISQPVV